jgi:hypothetical protein
MVIRLDQWPRRGQRSVTYQSRAIARLNAVILACIMDELTADEVIEVLSVCYGMNR